MCLRYFFHLLHQKKIEHCGNCSVCNLHIEIARYHHLFLYSQQNDLDVHKLSAQLTVINRDRLHSIGEVQAKMETLKQQYENARLEINRLTTRLKNLNSPAEQAQQYFTLLNKGDRLTESE